jgi:hypothetical protein
MNWRHVSVLALATACVASTVRADTLGDGWAWRRPIAFKQAVSDAPGESMAWAEFYANGQQAPDGSDIRVTSADRIIVPSKVMQLARESDFVRIAFATKSDGPYYVWWGNPKAEKPAKELEIKRGIHLEVSRNSVNGPDALNASRGPILASYILPEVSIGYNPFGEERQMVLHYSGSFKIDRAVTAQLAFTVNDLGVLTIDGNEIGRETQRQLKPQVRNPIALDLSAGWHSLDIKQVNLNLPNVIMALAWERPGEKSFTPFPGNVFASVARGVVGELEKVGSGGAVSGVPDITVEPAAEAFLPPSTYGQRYSFEALYPANLNPLILWDFGDGQTLAGLKKVSHIYLGPGNYPVTARLSAGTGMAAGGGSATVRLAVKDRLYEKFPRPVEDSGATIRSVLKDYKPDKLPADHAFRGMTFYESAGEYDGQILWGHAWLAGKDAAPPADAVIFDETFGLARLQIFRKDFKGAAESFRLASAKAAAMEFRANLMRHEVMTLCDYVDDPDAAVKEAQDWLRKINASNKPQTKTVQAAMAYALIAKGDGKGAKAAVDAAAAASAVVAQVPVSGGAGSGAIDAYNQRQIRQGVLTRNVENYLQSYQQMKDSKDLDTVLTLLSQWELEIPDAIWEGFTRTLRIKAAAAEGRNLVAARLGLCHARANPDGFYAAELLFRSAENFKLAGENQQAQSVLDLLASKYPESPYARRSGL